MAKNKGLKSLSDAAQGNISKSITYLISSPSEKEMMERLRARTVEENAAVLEAVTQNISNTKESPFLNAIVSVLTQVLYEQTGEASYRELHESFRHPVSADAGIGELPKSAEVREKMRGISFRVDSIKDPGQALLNYGLPMGYYADFQNARMDHFASRVAESTGGNAETIKDRETRTPKEQQEMIRLLAEDQMARLDAFQQSLFMRALNGIEHDDLPDLAAPASDTGKPFDLKEQAVLYYFATHDEMTPTADMPPNAETMEDIRSIYQKMINFYSDHAGEDVSQLLLSFIEAETPSRALAETIASQFPLIQNMTPKNHTIPNNPLMNALQQRDIIGLGPVDLVVANEKGKQKEITSYTIAAFDTGTSDIKITDTKLTEYERQVSDAIVSLWEEARKQKLDPVFTADAIYRAMPGGSDKASPQQKGAITKSIEKFRRLHITVNATEEMRRRRLIGEEDTMNFDDFYLSATRAEYRIKNGGQTVTAYRINAEPIVLTYCKMTRQLLTVPAKYLSIRKIIRGVPGESISMTPTRQAMTGYIIRRIRIMQRDAEQADLKKQTYDARRSKDRDIPEKTLDSFREHSDVISFEALFRDVGLSDQNRTEAKRNRDFCMDVLEYQKVVGFIKDYEVQTKGRSIIGIRIIN